MLEFNGCGGWGKDKSERTSEGDRGGKKDGHVLRAPLLNFTSLSR
jgi:hypothetical protein